MNNRIKSELLEIKGDRELLLAEEVVDWARSHPNSALHAAPEFCGWDEEKAAYHHYLNGARKLIAIHLVYQNGDRKFISLTLDRSREGGGYRDIDDVLKNQALTELMLDDALRDLARVKSKYEQLKTLAPVWTAVERVEKKRGGRKGGKEERATA